MSNRCGPARCSSRPHRCGRAPVVVRLRTQGAYGAVVPHALRGQDRRHPDSCSSTPSPPRRQLGRLASDMAGSPSDALAVFAVAGNDAGRSVESGSEGPRGFPAHAGQPRRRDQLGRLAVVGTLSSIWNYPSVGPSMCSVPWRCAPKTAQPL